MISALLLLGSVALDDTVYILENIQFTVCKQQFSEINTKTEYFTNCRIGVKKRGFGNGPYLISRVESDTIYILIDSNKKDDKIKILEN